jgi:Uma2 family endonuclease
MSSAPKVIHQEVVGSVYARLREHAGRGPLGRVFVSPMDVHLPSGDIVVPDVVFVSSANQRIVQDWIRGVPDLLVEVLSPNSVERDRVIKRDLYARNGVLEYWIVDPDTKAVEVFTLSGDFYKPGGYFESDDVLESSVLADFKLTVADLFRG